MLDYSSAVRPDGRWFTNEEMMASSKSKTRTRKMCGCTLCSKSACQQACVSVGQGWRVLAGVRYQQRWIHVRAWPLESRADSELHIFNIHEAWWLLARFGIGQAKSALCFDAKTLLSQPPRLCRFDSLLNSNAATCCCRSTLWQTLVRHPFTKWNRVMSIR